MLNAYDPDYVEKRIRPLFKGMPADEWITWRKESKVETVLPAEFEFPFRTAKKKTRKKQAGSTPIPPILLTYSG